MKILSIIITHNGAKWIDKCFGQLINSTIKTKILAIDNASTDQTPALIRNRFPQVEVVETGNNLGFGKANNIGMNRALKENADYVFLLNQDAWVSPCTLESLLAAHQTFKEYGILSPLHLTGKGDMLDANFSQYLTPAVRMKMFDDFILNKEKKVYEIYYVNAAAWLISKKCLETVGVFDPIFPHYGEDVDYAKRARFHGFSIGIAPESIIYHNREGRGTEHYVELLNRNLTNHLYTLKNINIPCWKCWILFTRNINTQIIKNLIHLDFKSVILNLLIFIKITKLAGTIQKNRSISKLNNCAFADIKAPGDDMRQS